MSDDIPVIPEEVPEFTGSLEQLDLGIAGVRSAGTSLRDSGSAIHTRFGGLSAYYKAPEAEALFATTAPVAAKGDEFATELETVASALDSYAAAVGPLKQKFDQLRQDAIAFRQRIEGDDEWRADGDLVEENNNRRSDINATYAAFQAAERDCYNKIVALVGGEALVVNDGSNKENMYGYRGEDLDNAGGLPWGDPVEESNPWYYIHEHVWDFAVGFVVDGVWGTIKGLGTLVGFNGWDAAGQAWVGLGKLATGILITAVPVVGAAYWLAPDDKLPSWLRDSRTAVVETGKALIAYDEWGKNPSRAAGAVTFNVLTTIFTGGAGGAVSGAGKAGAIAKAISFAGKAGKIVDPMTYLTKGIGATTVKISDVMASLRGITDGTHIKLGEGTYQIADPPNITDDLPAGLTPENSVRMETPKGEVVYLDTKTLVVHNADGTVRESLDTIKHEGTAAERGVDASRPEPELVGAGAKVGDGGTGAVGRVGDDGLPSATHETPGGTGGSHGGDGRTVTTGGGHAETPGGGHTETSGNSHTGPPAGGHGGTPGDNGTGTPHEPSDGATTPERANEPPPELTSQQKADHWDHLDEVESRSPDEFDQLQRDPDKNGGISEPSKDEARVGLDLSEQGRLPDDIQRPTEADRGEFYSPSADRYYDIKGVHSDWPPFNNVRDKSLPFKGAYDPAKNERWVKKLAEQIVEKQRVVILDMRNANQAAIDDIKSIVEKNGWEDDVIWYP
ncbi:hypothetical protein F9278_18285 [Streptomyces phaeolivaceus]|uniref:Uncharacterized protein n=1 Tax=Streptomyces phaeolivaceus TaxID=2653200 RepID=A0A5P8K4Z4_9ACTN|nr:hypothetical protein [Streptomyces phaeolivaceus]QFQ97852.1 hypothetical protein F9278_18285 [Streptomyces phaeolivaceus]